MNYAVFASGYGGNLQAIINAGKRKKIAARLALVVSDNPAAYALTRAKKARIPVVVINPRKFPRRDDFDREALKHLKRASIDFIVLAGFMRIISSFLVRRYRNKILNIHPALLPAFKGTHGIRDAFEYGVKAAGVTVHIVDEALDRGPIILQEALPVKKADTLARLEARIHALEHKLYPYAIDLFARGKITIQGRKTVIL